LESVLHQGLHFGDYFLEIFIGFGLAAIFGNLSPSAWSSIVDGKEPPTSHRSATAAVPSPETNDRLCRLFW